MNRDFKELLCPEDGIFTALVTTSERKKGGKSPKQVPRPRASELLCPESLANELVTPELRMWGALLWLVSRVNE